MPTLPEVPPQLPPDVPDAPPDATPEVAPAALPEPPPAKRPLGDRARRLAAGVAVAGACSLLLVNEWAIQRTRQALASDDVMLATRQKLQQLQVTMLRAENAQRSVLLTAEPALTEAFLAAQQQVEPLLTQLRQQQAGLAQRQAAVLEVEELTRRRLSEMATTVQLVNEGRARAALELVRSGIGGEYMRALEALVGDTLAAEAERMRQQRQALLDTLALGRAAIAALLLISVVAMWLYMRQSRLRERERAQQAQVLRGQRDQLETEVARRTQDLREIARHLQAAREDERSHLARELHDELGGLLTAAKLDVARLRRPLRELAGAQAPEFADVEARLAHLVQTLDSGIALKRRIIEDLRPSALSNLGLKVALENLCSDFAERSGLQVQADIAEIELDDEREITLYRVLQESLTNITRYAQAQRVDVELHLQPPGWAALAVRDDGVGFDTAAVPLRARGLAGMRFRMESCAGTLQLHSRPGAGTTVLAQMPLQAVPGG